MHVKEVHNPQRAPHRKCMTFGVPRMLPEEGSVGGNGRVLKPKTSVRNKCLRLVALLSSRVDI